MAKKAIIIDDPIVYRELSQYMTENISAQTFRRNASFATHVWIKHHADEFAKILFGLTFELIGENNDRLLR